MKNVFTKRIEILRKESMNKPVALSIERAVITTEFYKKNRGKYSAAMMRAKCFLEICKRKTIYIGEHELIVGEKGPAPKHVPTFPEIICHSINDLNTLRSRSLQPYAISDDDMNCYAQDVIPYWDGKTQYDKIFNEMDRDWLLAYESGVFTEFMEQRAAGHTALDDKIYTYGLNDLKIRIQKEIDEIKGSQQDVDNSKFEELSAMMITCDAAIIFANRHAELAMQMMEVESSECRKEELRKIAQVCKKVPAEKPETLWEAIQMYWFIHLGTVTELNGWDAMSPGHFDQHLYPFYVDEINKQPHQGHLNAKELLSCLWIKFNNQPAPPKVGVTALESGTYNDFVNINLGGVNADGLSAENELSYLMLEITEELHLLQPGTSVHISKVTSDKFLQHGLNVVSKGYGYPSIFNPDLYIESLRAQGKTIGDARSGGCSGCIEVGAFGKEAYVLTGYLNLPKILELTLNNGFDPISSKQVGLKTGIIQKFDTFNSLYDAFVTQLEYFITMKIRVSNTIDESFAKHLPAPFLSLYIDDCIKKGEDYYNGGPRYNTNYIQCTGLGTTTDSFSAILSHVFNDKNISLEELVLHLNQNFADANVLRQRLVHKTKCFGNDQDEADSIALRIFNELYRLINGRSNTRGGSFHMNMLSTTCHVYFGQITGATPNGRLSGTPISDGTSPSQGADCDGPIAVAHSLSKIDHSKTGGTLLNVRLLPKLFQTNDKIQKITSYVRSYFMMGGHHIQFNVVSTQTLIDAQKEPESYRDLMVRVAGYSDYFNDMNADLQSDIITRTENSDL